MLYKINGAEKELYSLSCEQAFNTGTEQIFSLNYKKGDIRNKTELVFRFPNRDAYSVWYPLHCYERYIHPVWRTSADFECYANNGIPLIQFIDKKGYNILTFALSDIHTPLHLRAGIDERSGQTEIKVTLFTQPVPPACGKYETGIYVCSSSVAYYEAIEGAMNYIREKNNAFPMGATEASKRRTYSTWYAFQKDITADAVLSQCRLAKDFGMDTVILDDGWQTPCSQGKGNAYITCGDWENYEPKFPSMRAFSDEVHKLGMNFILWIATPFIGSESREFAYFKGKLLRKYSSDGTVFIADPRFADVRAWYVKKLTTIFRQWNLDGFKLDFIDCFSFGEESSVSYEEMDIPLLGDAVDRLTSDITEALKQIKPDVMIEFRQSYIGPAMQKNCNMVRVEDCAYGAMFNRQNGIDLRLISGNNAVHSDMLMWDYLASPEAAADQLSNILFIVPQISMLFDRLSPEHRRVLEFYLDFIDSNRNVLQYGKLVPLYTEAGYPVVYAYSEDSLVAALYGSELFTVNGKFNSVKIVNATGSGRIVADLGDSFDNLKEYVIYNCMGETVTSGKTEAALSAYSIPHNGIICFS